MSDSRSSLREKPAMGSREYHAFIGPPEKYDIASAMQFNFLTLLGLRQTHSLLDIGCGSLRAGKLFIPYLLPGHCCGIEPEQWLLEEGIINEVGQDLIDMKRPVFSNDMNFTLSTFNRDFDFILAQSIFSHASKHQISTCVSEAKKVMTPTSVLAATFLEGDDDYAGSQWVYPGCVTYLADTMTKLVEEQGLVCKYIHWHHPNKQTWMCIVHPERKQDIPDLGGFSDLTRLTYELASCKEHLSQIKNHPYVKVGLMMRRCLRRFWK